MFLRSLPIVFQESKVYFMMLKLYCDLIITYVMILLYSICNNILDFLPHFVSSPCLTLYLFVFHLFLLFFAQIFGLFIFPLSMYVQIYLFRIFLFFCLRYIASLPLLVFVHLPISSHFSLLHLFFFAPKYQRRRIKAP